MMYIVILFIIYLSRHHLTSIQLSARPGNRYILGIMCLFSKWVELFAIQEKSVVQIATHMQHFVLRLAIKHAHQLTGTRPSTHRDTPINSPGHAPFPMLLPLLSRISHFTL